MNETVVTTLLIISIVGMFTNFFGLADVWANRGKWYTVSFDQLDTVMKNLVQLGAFQDSDGLPSNFIKVKAYRTDLFSTVQYQVKVPNWVFKYHETKLDDKARANLLGID